MTEQEAQQAQTIAEDKIRKILYRYRGHIEEEDMDALLEIVDSQAQTISEQAKEIERLKAIESDLEAVKSQSIGIAGYHLNGDIATWDEVGL